MGQDVLLELLLALRVGQQPVDLRHQQHLHLVLTDPHGEVAPAAPGHGSHVGQQPGGDHLLQAGLAHPGNVQVLQQEGDAGLAVPGQHHVVSSAESFSL